MDSNNMYYMMPLNDSSSSFEYSPQYPPITSTSCNLKKPYQQSQSKDKSSYQRPEYADDVPGPINLDLVVIAGDVPNLCTYSKKLKRIYTQTNQALRFRFAWSPNYQPLYLRSALIFAEDYHNSKHIVQRCYMHQNPDLPQNDGVSFDQLRHVFRVSDPGNTYKTIYETDANNILSTRTAVRPGESEIWLDLKFFCQNSCATGISRRATKLVFLVEDAMGVVIAQRSALIQICSNPKRDKDRDEGRIVSDSRRIKKKMQSQPPLPPSNFENSLEEDGTVYALNVDVMGEENYKKVLQFAYDLMASQAARTGNYQLYEPHMDAIKMKEFEE